MISGSLKAVTRPTLADPQQGPSGWVPPLLEIHRKIGLFSRAATSRASRTDNRQGIDQTRSVAIRVSRSWSAPNSPSASAPPVSSTPAARSAALGKGADFSAGDADASAPALAPRRPAVSNTDD